MMLFVIFALVVVIATGIPYVKKGIENRKLMKEYMEENKKLKEIRIKE